MIEIEKDRQETIEIVNKSVQHLMSNIERIHGMSDPEVIKAQRNTIYLNSVENTELKKKLETMQRNFEAASKQARDLNIKIKVLEGERLISEAVGPLVQTEIVRPFSNWKRTRTSNNGLSYVLSDAEIIQ